ncbi:hypothetical protein U1769_04215 [Sphingomonas sp. ZT3P38]|uniref:hypothetical protein n=1 Tax=Parasphingomonas zepuensis TaxID=3096161 RepID=UPI002FC5C6A6
MPDEPISPVDMTPEDPLVPQENLCPECGGTGELRGRECPACLGTGNAIGGIGGG